MKYLSTPASDVWITSGTFYTFQHRYSEHLSFYDTVLWCFFLVSIIYLPLKNFTLSDFNRIMSDFFDKYLKKASFPHKGLHYSKRLSHGGHMFRSLLLVEVFILFYFFYFWRKISLCSPGTCYIDQAIIIFVLETELFYRAQAGLKPVVLLSQDPVCQECRNLPHAQRLQDLDFKIYSHKICNYTNFLIV